MYLNEKSRKKKYIITCITFIFHNTDCCRLLCFSQLQLHNPRSSRSLCPPHIMISISISIYNINISIIRRHCWPPPPLGLGAVDNISSERVTSAAFLLFLRLLKMLRRPTRRRTRREATEPPIAARVVKGQVSDSDLFEQMI